ncbi:MAG: SDR family oxidoreductase [Propionibacteriaceae bacterium]|nr:SDR family oxidoreductase [Propionibacteriaceae bacterium]
MTYRVCITGAGSGIGRQVAIDFGKLGYDITIIGRRTTPLSETAASIAASGAAKVTMKSIDLRETSCIDELASLVKQGPFNAVVAVAGGNAELIPETPDLHGLDLISWYWDENFRSNVLTAVHFIEGLRQLNGLADGASVVLLSSIAAHRGSGSGSYAASKAALHPYTIDLARSLASKRITVNAVSPGYISGTEFFLNSMTTERHNSLVAQTFTGRVGEPADVSSAVMWLCSEGARHVTGQVLQINGGANT